MLTGDIGVSAGDAFIYSHSVRNALENVHRNLGYCPQFDGVIGEMTGRETLRLFSRLRGIPESEIPALTEKLSHRLIFSQHIDKEVRHYRLASPKQYFTANNLIGRACHFQWWEQTETVHSHGTRWESSNCVPGRT